MSGSAQIPLPACDSGDPEALEKVVKAYLPQIVHAARGAGPGRPASVSSIRRYLYPAPHVP